MVPGCTPHPATIENGTAEAEPAAPAAAAAASAAAAAAPGVTLEVLKKQDSTTSSAICDAFNGNEKFTAIAKIETAQIMKRDEEDGEQLAKGIKVAVDKVIWIRLIAMLLHSLSVSLTDFFLLCCTHSGRDPCRGGGGACDQD